MPRIEIAPSILTADFTRLGEQVGAALQAGATRIHLDVMDGRFVPNISFGPLVINSLRPLADAHGALTEAHLMIVEPERYITDFARAGSDVIIVHPEATPHLHRCLQMIKGLGKKAGAAINPSSPIALIEEVLADLDHVLVMTVNPGFGGQELIPSCLDKVRRLRDLLDSRGLTHVPIQVDGGIHVGTAAAAVAAGATVLVAGSAVFNPRMGVAESVAALQAAL